MDEGRQKDIEWIDKGLANSSLRQSDRQKLMRMKQNIARQTNIPSLGRERQRMQDAIKAKDKAEVEKIQENIVKNFGDGS